MEGRTLAIIYTMMNGWPSMICDYLHRIRYEAGGATLPLRLDGPGECTSIYMYVRLENTLSEAVYPTPAVRTPPPVDRKI